METYGATGVVEFALVCEHASAFIPPVFGNLGLSREARKSHIAWDPGARDLAVALTDRLAGKLVAGTVSRLVYDCNRPLEAPDSIVELAEATPVPGNRGLSRAEREARFTLVHDPFHAAVADALDTAGPEAMLVTVHSFTRIYRGAERAVEIGYLWHDDDRLGRAALACEHTLGRRRAAANEPYSAKDGVTYTLAKHGAPRSMANVMIEVRSDLIDTRDQIEAMADDLAHVLKTARGEVAG